MGSMTGYICGRCGQHFSVTSGGGFFFDTLHCDLCGRARNVSHQDMGDAHLGFVKGLPGPYAIARRGLDQQIKDTYEGPTLTRDDYQTAVEEQLDPCKCGGRFRYDAPPRCPNCRSTQDEWVIDPNAGHAFID